MNTNNHVISFASFEDVDDIYSLIEKNAHKGLILKRSKEDIAYYLGHFFVSKYNGKFSGVGSYYDYGESLKEIRSLAVLDEHKQSGIGSLLLQKVISYLKHKGNPKIFVLTYSPNFFIKNGFKIVTKDTLPEKIWKDCDFCPNKNHCVETALVYVG